MPFNDQAVLCSTCDAQLDGPKNRSPVVVCSACSSRLAQSSFGLNLTLTKAAPEPILAILDDGRYWFNPQSSPSEDAPATAATTPRSSSASAQQPTQMEVLNMFNSPTFSGISSPIQEHGVGHAMSMLLVYDPNSRFRNQMQNDAREVSRQKDWEQLDYWLQIGVFRKFTSNLPVACDL